ncbi:MAG: branched-chain amino acid ABC transporter permease [Armatimonadota bacterium]|nr:branched-chain amino acid ABC transporter permease [Armatimonadota bacterium]MDR7450665.1 branched-chain amino acid ABC transporter permease [Armatimonadota bacterium]MDR7466021.1 branched-chain amino acid ABC transporter permease [Armatimonadota bacterium]MDR7493942.1 branched-chain amino acid ABC transporter permease [Armatimonadota bacterium]MDR7504047.1 branched-chain amino acid ABC transporter permease [Armatimonadota bacterium]
MTTPAIEVRSPARSAAPRWTLGILLGTALLLLPFAVSSFWIRIATEVLLWAGLAQSWNIIGGYTGYLSFGHGAFFGLGAYITGIGMTVLGWSFPAGLVVSGVLAAALAAAIGYPTLRLRGAYFAIATWAFGEMLRQVATVLDITGGAFGMRLPALLNLPFFYYVTLGTSALVYVTTYLLLERSPFGYKLLAIREHEEAAEMVGVNTVAVKINAFALSAFFPGVLGGIYAYWLTYIHPDSVLGGIITDLMVVMVFLGGMGTFWGPLLGAFLVQLVSRSLWLVWGESTLYLVIIGAAICIVVLFMPGGIVGLLEGRRTPLLAPHAAWRWWRERMRW